MSTIDVHPRVMRRHPDVRSEDVLLAMESMVRYKRRSSGEWIAIGIDKRNRPLELVYLYDEEEDTFFVYHAMTPPSARTYEELDMRRRSQWM